ncbi:MAG: ferritin-like domain-containing protein [Elusimicrobiota bacterium]
MAKNDSGKKAVLEVLNKARASEIAAILQYMSQHYALDDADYGQVAANVKLIAIDEMRHAEMLAERLHELGGTPTSEPDMKAKKGQKIGEAMAQDVGLEETAIADYNAFAEVCRQNNDRISQKLCEQIMEEEQIHLNYFQNVRDHIKDLGNAYLAQITGGPADAGAPAAGFVANQAKAGPA